MRWKGRRESDNVEDRRGGGGVKAGGISILGLVVAFIAWKFFGVDPQQFEISAKPFRYPLVNRLAQAAAKNLVVKAL